MTESRDEIRKREREQAEESRLIERMDRIARWGHNPPEWSHGVGTYECYCSDPCCPCRGPKSGTP